ncbi:MAG: 3-phosphoshikimate 1-carboxyvinyltransferase [Bacteroidetes bacterium]|nr:3-phosphoshikimate 1-carboxyvinyltransferase [Bacteroidota bacterium]
MKITALAKKFSFEAQLPGSKSLSNRALMIAAYSGIPFKINNLSEADDTGMLIRNLDYIRNCINSSMPLVVDCGNAGTVFRFLLTYLATTPGNWMLTGTVRMKSRPIAGLVESLRQLGAEIYYTEEEGFPPVRVVGKKLKGGKTSVSMQQSSQFASSLLMAGPTWQKGLDLDLTDGLNSLPYLEMTIRLMEQCGAKVMVAGRKISVLPVAYKPQTVDIEPDWSSAAFWYQMVALSEGAEVYLPGLLADSLQGDSKAMEMFAGLGVKTEKTENGLRLVRNGLPDERHFFDLHDHPDMLPALVATCAGLQCKATFTGLDNLQYKESNRTASIAREFAKLGADFVKVNESTWQFHPSAQLPKEGEPIRFNVYADHRLAMAFAPLALKINTLVIDDPDCVVKSYPAYWKQLQATGAFALE